MASNNSTVWEYPFLVLGKEVSQKFHLARPGRNRLDGLEFLLGRVRVALPPWINVPVPLAGRAGAGVPALKPSCGPSSLPRVGWLLLAHPSGGLPLVARAFARRVARGVECPVLLPALLVPVEVGFQGGMDHLHFDHHPAENFFFAERRRAGSGERICHSGVLPRSS